MGRSNWETPSARRPAQQPIRRSARIALAVAVAEDGGRIRSILGFVEKAPAA
jgi:hypothetical protein